MVEIHQREPFSYRHDPSVPRFDDGGPIAFVDGECGLCSRGARIIVRLDKRGEFRICPTQSSLGQAILTHYGLDPTDPDSWLYLVDGKAYGSIDGITRVGARLGGLGRILAVLRILPRALQNWIYRRIARNRYRLFGRKRVCDLPDPALRRRLIE